MHAALAAAATLVALAFGAATFFNAFDAHDNAVAVHRFVEERTGNVDVAAGVERPFGRDESIAGWMRLQPADIQIHLFGQTESMAAELNELARGDQRFDVALERRAVVARNLEQLKEFPHGSGMVDTLAHQREHLITGKHMVLSYARCSVRNGI